MLTLLHGKEESKLRVDATDEVHVYLSSNAHHLPMLVKTMMNLARAVLPRV